MTDALMDRQEESEVQESNSYINMIIRRFNMTDTLMEKAEMAGQEEVVYAEKPKSYLNMFILGVLVLGAVIMGWQIYEYLTPDPWYIRINPF